MKISKTKENSLSRGPSKNFVVCRHNDIIIEILDVIHYDAICMHIVGTSTQSVLLGFRNLHTKNHAFSTLCEISTPLTPTINHPRVAPLLVGGSCFMRAESVSWVNSEMPDPTIRFQGLM